MQDEGSIPRWGRPLAGGNGYSFQYSCLANSMDRGAWRATVHGVIESQTQQATKQQQSEEDYKYLNQQVIQLLGRYGS